MQAPKVVSSGTYNSAPPVDTLAVTAQGEELSYSNVSDISYAGRSRISWRTWGNSTAVDVRTYDALLMGYARCFQALNVPDDELEPAARHDGIDVLSALMAASVPVPKIFWHGGDAVVFTWRHKDTDADIYLTVLGEGLVSLLNMGCEPPWTWRYDLRDTHEFHRLVRALGGKP